MKINHFIIAITIAISVVAVYGEFVYLPETSLFSRHLFYLPIALGGVYYGTKGGIVTSLISIFFFFPIFLLEIEKTGFSIANTEHLVTIVIFLALGLISGSLVHQYRRQSSNYEVLYKIEALLRDRYSVEDLTDLLSHSFGTDFTSFVIKLAPQKYSVITSGKNTICQKNKNVITDGSTLIDLVAESKEFFYSPLIDSDKRIATTMIETERDFPQSLCLAPLEHNEHFLGILAFGRDHYFNKQERQDIRTIAKNIALNIHNQKLYLVTITDKLTGVLNRRCFDNHLQHYCMNVDDNNTISLAIIDIDFFKKINDSYGHPTGDKVLAYLGKILNSSVFPDSAYRIGGEEFAILLPKKEQKDTVEIAERLRQTIEQKCRHLLPDSRVITVSIGIASSSDHTNSPEELFSQADQALYQAKHTGRNKVCIYGQDNS